MELMLKHGCNPNQKPSRIFRQDGGELPVAMLNGRPGYINFLDALNSWQLVKELKAATRLLAAAPFKHVNPTGVAVGAPMPPELQKSCFVDDLELSPLACAHARIRGAGRISSYGDWATLFSECDTQTARLIPRGTSDGIIVPGYSAEALETLKAKRRGSYSMVQINPEYVLTPVEHRDVFGITSEQGRNNVVIDESLLINFVTDGRTFFAEAERNLLVVLIMLKYTQSNSICYTKDGQAIGMGTRQQSRTRYTRLAENEAGLWHPRQRPQVLNLPFRTDIRRLDRDNTIDAYPSGDVEEVLVNDIWQQFFTECPAPLSREEKRRYLSGITGASLGSDAFFPFGDSIERAYRNGVSSVAQSGGSVRNNHVIDTYNKYDIAMVFTGLRLFHCQSPRYESVIRSEVQQSSLAEQQGKVPYDLRLQIGSGIGMSLKQECAKI